MRQFANWNGQSQRKTDGRTAHTCDPGLRGRCEHCDCGIVMELDGGPGQAYNEEAFRQFLSAERKRSQTSGRPFLLMLVDFGETSRGKPLMNVDRARTIFTGLGRCLRETDLVGWYRDGRVAGAVLTQLSPAQLTEVRGRMIERTDRMVRGPLGPDVGKTLRVRIFQLPATRWNT